MRAVSTEIEITLGVEEELWVIDAASGDVAASPPEGLIEACAAAAAPNRVVRELLRCQIETNSTVTSGVSEAAAALHDARRAVRRVCAAHGLDAVAVSSHPWARWEEQQIANAPRYRKVEAEMQDVVRRYFVSGMHVHAGFGDAEERIAVMRRLRGELPLLLALSTSSVFHAGRMTGLKSFRAQITASLPRSGAPPVIDDWQSLEASIERYRAMGAVEDGTELRWDLRPSVRYPTLELRVCDACPRIADAAALIALYACLVRESLEAHRRGAPEPPCMDEAITEGRWRAARYGAFAELPAPASGEPEGVDERTRKTVKRLAAQAEALDCRSELARLEDIVAHGTSADRQYDAYNSARSQGADHEEGLRAALRCIREDVVDDGNRE